MTKTPMTSFEEIKAAVSAGKNVFWKTPSYRVMLDSVGQWLVVCVNGDCQDLIYCTAKDFYTCAY